jgi:hypothetical protein
VLAIVYGATSVAADNQTFKCCPWRPIWLVLLYRRLAPCLEEEALVEMQETSLLVGASCQGELWLGQAFILSCRCCAVHASLCAHSPCNLQVA